MEILTTLKKCVICGKEFKPHNKKQECCGTACALEKTKKYQIAHRKMRICKCCGKEFWKFDAYKKLMFAGAVKIVIHDFSKIRSWLSCKKRAKAEAQ